MKCLNRIIAGVLAAAIVITCVEVVPAAAAETKAKLSTAQRASITDLSARRRYRSNAAAIAAFAAVAGTIASIAAAEQRRQEWEDYHRYGYYGYGYAPAPYPYRYHRYYWQGW